ncbi:MAG: AI-2E family transporter [Acidimicrobiia bacterium]
MGRSATDGIRRAGVVAWAFVGVALAVAVLGWVAMKVVVIFPPLILAAALVFILNPLITFMAKAGVPRLLGVCLTYLGFMAVLTGLGFVLYPVFENQAETLSERWPEIRTRVENWVDDRAQTLEGTPFEFEFDTSDLGGNGSESGGTSESGDDGPTLQDQIETVADVGFRVFHVLLILILAPIFAFYLLVDLPRLRRVAEGLVPDGSRREVLVVGRRINEAVGGFFRGQLVVAAIVGIMSSVALRIIGLPFWLLLGMLAGLFNLIPLVGPYIGGAVALIVAVTTRDPITGVWVVVAMVIVQQIDNHFISPVVMSRVVKLHPVLVMVSLLLGGTLGGFFGLLVAVPAAAIVKIVLGHVWRVHVLGEPLEERVSETTRQDDGQGVGFVAEVGDASGS